MIIKDMTPTSFQCVVGACPSFFETDKNTYILVGVQIHKSEIKNLGIESRVGGNEVAIEIPKELIDNA